MPLAALTAWQAHAESGKAQAGAAGADPCRSGRSGRDGDPDCQGFWRLRCRHGQHANQDLLRELGADLAIDYTREQIRRLRPKFDLVLDGVGKSVWAEIVSRAEDRRPAGYFGPAHSRAIKRQAQVFFNGDSSAWCGGVARGLPGGKRLLIARVKPRGGELEKISALIEAGKIRAVVEKVFALEQIAEAHRLSEQGHVRGKLVISIQQLSN